MKNVKELENENIKEEWLVYVHWIEKDGVIKRYFGITHHQNPEKRWDKRRGYRPHGYTKGGRKRRDDESRFYNAIKKYGWESFQHDILFTGLTKDQADEKERELIMQYKSYEEDYGYNMDMGGHNQGKHSEETKRKIKENHADISGVNNVLCKGTVVQISFSREYIAEYESVAKASELTKINADPIRQAAIHNICSAGGFLWFWKDEYDSLDKETIYYKPDNRRPVIQLDKDGKEIAEYDSCKEASIAVGGSGKSSSITAAIKNNHCYKGYYWKYKHEKYNNVKNKLERWANSPRNRK